MKPNKKAKDGYVIEWLDGSEDNGLRLWIGKKGKFPQEVIIRDYY